jgi:O-methyltransferase
MGILGNALRSIGARGTGPSADQARNDAMAANLYIELLKRCVSNAIYDDDLDLMRASNALDPATGRYVAVDPQRADEKLKYLGGVWPSRAHTMVGIPRLDNLRHCVETALVDGVQGDFIETGVWRGGASIFLRGILKAYGVTDRIVWVADSFEGLPPPDLAKYPKEAKSELHLVQDLAVSLEQVRENFARYDLLDDQVRFLKGWFRDTLPNAPVEALAVMRLDGDLYESTMDGLAALWPKLSPGGFAIIDDFHSVPACGEAVNDYRRANGIATPMEKIQGGGVFWRKEGSSA